MKKSSATASVQAPKEALPVPMKKRSALASKFHDGKYLFLLVIPTLICLILFHYVPMYGLIISFMDYEPFKGIFGSNWVGLHHFERFFNYKFFWRILRNTVSLSILSLVWGFPMPIIFALVLNEVQNVKFKKLVQTVSYMPHFYSTVVVVGLCAMLLSPTSGMIINFVEALGFGRPNLLVQPEWFRALYIITDLWQGTGWGAIVYLAALTNVDPQLYEAAYVDGAGKMRCVWSITLPSIAPTMITMLLLRMGSIFNVGFEKAYLFQTPNTYETSEIISTYVYKVGMGAGGGRANFSYGSAVGLFNSIVSLILVLASNKVSAAVSETSLW